MLKLLCGVALLSSVTTTALAHEIWLERHPEGVRAYVVDATGDRDKGEDIAKLVPTSRLFKADRTRIIPVAAQPDHLIATVQGQQDLRYYNDQVWAPWKGKDGGYEAAAFQANTSVTVINPDLWEKNFRTEGSSRLTVPVGAKGRHILVARHNVPANVEIAGQRVAKLQHVASLSFEND